MFKPPDTVPFRRPTGGFTAVKVYRDAWVPPCREEPSRIGNGIPAGATVQDVRAATAFQVVITGTALQMIIAVAALQVVSATAAVQYVCAGVAQDGVVTIVADQRVRIVATDNVLETSDSIPCGMAAGGFTGAQVHHHACVRPVIRDGVLTGAAVQGVCAGITLEGVIVIIAGQRVRIGAAGKILYPTDPVPCCVPAGGLAGTQVYCHSRI